MNLGRLELLPDGYDKLESHSTFGIQQVA